MTPLFWRIVEWAKDRNLIEGSKPSKQMLKLTEEIGELAGAVARAGDPAGYNYDGTLRSNIDNDNLIKIKDGIGDSVVVLTILAAQYGLDISDCLYAAWEEIKDRKGRMVDGVFVKEGEG